AAGWVARAAGGTAAMLVAAAVVAFYPPLVSGSGALLSEPLGALLATLAVGAAGWGARDGRLAALFPCGVLLGVLALIRADLLLAPVVVGAVLMFSGRSLRELDVAEVVADYAPAILA